jgi:hypothetical protein
MLGVESAFSRMWTGEDDMKAEISVPNPIYKAAERQ